MSEFEMEENLKAFNIKKNYQENIYHNKIYLFNTQIIDNNIKELKRSIIQKTQFLQKHDTIDNMQKEIKYEFRKTHHKNNSNVKNHKFLLSSENNFDQIENNIKINQILHIEKNKNNDKVSNYGNLLNMNDINHKFAVNLEDNSIGKNKQNELQLETTGFLEKEPIEKKKNAKLYSISHPNKKGNQDKTKTRFLTSIENSNGLLIYNSNYHKAKTKLQKFSKKINLKSRNTVDVSVMKGISEDDNETFNKSNKSVINNENNINTHFQLNYQNYNHDNNIINEGKNNEFLNLKDKDKKQLNFLKNYNEKFINENESNNFNQINKDFSLDFSKTNSKLKIKERDIILNLNLLKNIPQNKFESNLEFFNCSQIINRSIKNNLNKKKINSNNHTLNKNSYLNNNEDLIKFGHLNYKDNANATQENIYKLLDYQPKLITDYPKNKLGNLQSQIMTMEEFKTPANYLLSKPNLITNTEINANIKKNSKEKFDKKTLSRSFKILEKEDVENNSNFNNNNKEINKLFHHNKSNILINENYNQPSKVLKDFQAIQIENSKVMKNEKSQILKRIDISENNINSNLNITNTFSHNYNEKFNIDEIDPHFKEKNEEINRDIKTKINKFTSDLCLNSQQIANENQTNVKNNIISKNLSKIKITDRIALMSKGIMKDSYNTETDKIFSKIFNKNLEEILEMKKYPIRAASLEKLNIHDERFKFSKRNSISKEITELKEKVYFLKGTLDYIFPQYLIGKLNETAKKQKISNIIKINRKINDSNIVTLTSDNDSLKKSFCNTKSNNKNKEVSNGIFIVENTDKNSSNGNSKNEFFFPNINSNTNNSNKFNNHPINNNYNITIYNTVDVNNNNQINETFENNEAIKTKYYDNMKNKNKINFNLINLNTTKLISSETNSSLFYKFSNFKNKSKNHSNNYLFGNNPLNELPLPEQKRIIKKQILSKTIPIQNTNTFNN